MGRNRYFYRSGCWRTFVYCIRCKRLLNYRKHNHTLYSQWCIIRYRQQNKCILFRRLKWYCFGISKRWRKPLYLFMDRWRLNIIYNRKNRRQLYCYRNRRCWFNSKWYGSNYTTNSISGYQYSHRNNNLYWRNNICNCCCIWWHSALQRNGDICKSISRATCLYCNRC